MDTYFQTSLGILITLLIVAIPLLFFIKKFRDQFSQLSYQNRLFKALRNLDETALSTTELEELCQQIVNVIRQELGYFFGAIALVEPKSNSVRRMAISKSEIIDSVLQKMPIPYKEQAVSLDNQENLLVKSILEKKTIYTDNLYDIQIGIYPEAISLHLQKILQMKGFFIYPLVSKNNKVIGVIYYCTTIPKEKFSKFEFDIMDNFSREVARVLDNATLYKNLRQTSEELISANNRLKSLDKLKDEFVSLASHELRTPMTAIRSYAWMALHKADVPLSQKLEKYLVRIVLSSERLINLVNDMLNISRIESNRIEIVPEAVDLTSLCKDIMDEVYYSKSEEKKIQFVLLEQRLPRVFADPEKLRQVLLNLVGNALKFSPQGGKITLSFFTDGKVVETNVKDEGPGIAREDLGKLFQKFGRLDASYTAAATTGGTGLGLYISKSLINLMHGRIWAMSEGLGKGATFAFSLPVATPLVVAHADKFSVKAVGGEAKGLEPVAI